MKCTMDFKFDMGSTVRFRMGKCIMEGKVTEVLARIAPGFSPYYRIQIGNGKEYKVPEKDLWIVSRVPRWLRPGAEVQWMGDGPHEKYVVKELRRGGKYRPRSFEADRELFRSDGTSCGRERTSTECTPDNLAFWRYCPTKEKG